MSNQSRLCTVAPHQRNIALDRNLSCLRLCRSKAASNDSPACRKLSRPGGLPVCMESWTLFLNAGGRTQPTNPCIVARMISACLDFKFLLAMKALSKVVARSFARPRMLSHWNSALAWKSGAKEVVQSSRNLRICVACARSSPASPDNSIANFLRILSNESLVINSVSSSRLHQRCDILQWCLEVIEDHSAGGQSRPALSWK